MDACTRAARSALPSPCTSPRRTADCVHRVWHRPEISSRDAVVAFIVRDLHHAITAGKDEPLKFYVSNSQDSHDLQGIHWATIALTIEHLESNGYGHAAEEEPAPTGVRVEEAGLKIVEEAGAVQVID